MTRQRCSQLYQHFWACLNMSSSLTINGHSFFTSSRKNSREWSLRHSWQNRLCWNFHLKNKKLLRLRVDLRKGHNCQQCQSFDLAGSLSFDYYRRDEWCLFMHFWMVYSFLHLLGWYLDVIKRPLFLAPLPKSCAQIHQ